MVLEPELSNLTGNPDWPILVANLVRWCLAQTPGPAASNVRLGSDAENHALADDAAAAGNAVVTLPGGRRAIAADPRQATWKCIPITSACTTSEPARMQFPFRLQRAERRRVEPCRLRQRDSGVIGMSRRSFKISGSTWTGRSFWWPWDCLTVQMVVVSRAGAARVMTLTWPFWLILIIPALVAFWLRPLPSRGLTLLRG